MISAQERVADSNFANAIDAHFEHRFAGDIIDAQQIYDSIYNAIADVFESDRFVISINRADGIYERVYVSGISSPKISTELVVFPTWLAEARGHQNSFIANHPDKIFTSDTETANLGLNSWMEAAIVFGDKVVGFVSLYSKQRFKYSAPELEALSKLLVPLAPALAAAPLAESSERSVKVQRAISSLSAKVADIDEMEVFYEQVTVELKTLLDFDRLTLSRFDEDKLELQQEFVAGTRIPTDGPARVISEFNDKAAWNRLAKNYEPKRRWRKWFEEYDLTSWLQGPMQFVGGEIDGFISLRRSQNKPFSYKEQLTLTEFASNLSPLVNKIRGKAVKSQLKAEKEISSALSNDNLTLTELVNAKSEFLAKVSHEFRTPLTTISAFGDVMSHDVQQTLSDRQKSELDVIRRATADLRTLVDDLLDLSEAEAGSFELDLVELTLDEVVNSCVESCAPLLVEKQQQLTVNRTDSNPRFVADDVRIRQVFRNLISNASKYSPTNSEIILDVHDDESTITFKVTDSGRGMSKDELKRATLPFFRSNDPEIQAEIGTGLGLSVVNSIVESHGGTLDLTSKPNEGTTASLTLPVSPTG